MDSAMLTSGSLPMSSAEIASTTEVASCLTAIALDAAADAGDLHRIQVGGGGAGRRGGALRGLCRRHRRRQDNGQRDARALRLWFNIFPPRQCCRSICERSGGRERATRWPLSSPLW